MEYEETSSSEFRQRDEKMKLIVYSLHNGLGDDLEVGLRKTRVRACYRSICIRTLSHICCIHMPMNNMLLSANRERVSECVCV